MNQLDKIQQNSPTQCDAIIEYIREFGAITPLDAMRDLGVMRLGARIWELKRSGYSIHGDLVEVDNRWGGKAHVARYRLAQEQNEQKED